MKDKNMENMLKKLQKSPKLVEELEFEQLEALNEYLAKQVVELRRAKR